MSFHNGWAFLLWFHESSSLSSSLAVFHTIITMVKAHQVIGYIFKQIYYDGCHLVIFLISWFLLRVLVGILPSERDFFFFSRCLCRSVFYHYLFWCPFVPDGASERALKMAPGTFDMPPSFFEQSLYSDTGCPRFFYKTFFFIFRPQTSHFLKNPSSF